MRDMSTKQQPNSSRKNVTSYTLANDSQTRESAEKVAVYDPLPRIGWTWTQASESSQEGTQPDQCQGLEADSRSAKKLGLLSFIGNLFSRHDERPTKQPTEEKPGDRTPKKTNIEQDKESAAKGRIEQWLRDQASQSAEINSEGPAIVEENLPYSAQMYMTFREAYKGYQSVFRTWMLMFTYLSEQDNIRDYEMDAWVAGMEVYEEEEMLELGRYDLIFKEWIYDKTDNERRILNKDVVEKVLDSDEGRFVRERWESLKEEHDL